MSEKQKITVTKKREFVRTSDIYLSAYLLAKGAGVEDVELVKEFDKNICLLILSGESIQSHQQTYLNNQALIDPLLYQKALNRIRDVVFKAMDQVKNTFGQGGRQ